MNLGVAAVTRKMKQETSQHGRKAKFDLEHFLAAELAAKKVVAGKKIVQLQKNQPVIAQGAGAACLFFISEGRVKLSVSSESGKEATLAILGPGDFFGEEALAVEPSTYGVTAITLTNCTLLQMERDTFAQVLVHEPDFCAFFIPLLVGRIARVRDGLVDQLFHSTEKRLARALLSLTPHAKSNNGTIVVPRVSQETLAAMIGTSRSRVNLLMNRFKKLGLIQYNGELTINTALLDVVLHD